MATTDAAPDAGLDASSVAETLRGAAFVHFLPAADGDCLAAAGLLARACNTLGVPFQVSVARTASDRDARVAAIDGDATPLPIDRDGPAPAAAVAFAAADALGADPDPVTALAGAAAAGTDPGGAIPAALERAGIERRPGLGIPTDDVADGLAHSTLVYVEYSGDPDAAREAVDALGVEAPLDDVARRRLASLVSLAVAGDDAAPARAATAVEAVLRPYATDAPFATLAGYADVLDTLAPAAPGLATGLVLGRDVADAALDAWRRHARAAHAAVRTAAIDVDGAVAVARVDGPVEPTARLLRDYRVAADAVLAIGDGEAAIAAADADAGRAFADAVRGVEGSALDRGDVAYGRLDPGREDDLVDGIRGAR